METVGLLAGGVAHDFNNILQIIMTSCSILLKKAQNDQECQIMLSSISDATRRGKELVGQLLVFSRRNKASLKYCNLQNLVEGFMKMIKRIIGEEIEVKLLILDKACNVKVDSGQIEQVLMNLCMNAKDAMPQGGKITISVSKFNNLKVHNAIVSSIPKGEYGVISVKDTGYGIPESILKKVFAPFFTTKDVGKGTGLGLATVYGIVEEHHGYVDVKSELGVGTEFLIYIPLSDSLELKEDAEVEAISDKLIQGFGFVGKVLIAEDDPIVRMLTATSLRELGLTVVETENGISAVNYFSENYADIKFVLMDVIMPKMSGFTAFEMMREIVPDIPVIFASGYAEDRLKLEERNVTMVEFLQKPYEVADMAIKIKELLTKKNSGAD